MTITYADFLNTVEENEGLWLWTVGGNKQFQSQRSGSGVSFTLRDTGDMRSEGERVIQRCLNRFNETGSFTTTGYQRLTHNSVYVLGIIKLWWEKEVAGRARYEKQKAAVAEETADMDLNVDLDEAEEFGRLEGMWRVRLHLYRERDRELGRRAKEAFRVKHGGRLFCEVCGFDFGEVYGEPDFIEAHHRVPLRDLEAATRTKVSDLAMVCANCHRMLHRGNPWLDVEKLKKRMKPSL